METALQQKSCCLRYCHHISFSPIASSQPQVGFDCDRFNRCAAVPCDSALICWQSIAVVPSKIQDFGRVSPPDGRISSLVKPPDTGAAVPTSQSKHFCQRQGECQWKSRSQRWDTSMWLNWIVIVIVGFLVAPALETQRFTRTNIAVCFCRVVWILQFGRLFLLVVNWTSRSYFFRADDPDLAS